ncbi:MAG: polysaccharide deacetylase family protein [Pseudomonadales bacterium]|nr:polysaccharide deacetylase family protein [Halioglobus sp.]MCP5129860.1 polysaccharide deacetylase family protein [Pseudomonadales bacterium]
MMPLAPLTHLLPHLLRTGSEQRLSVLSYHRVLLAPDAIRHADPTVEKFSWQMEVIGKYFNPLPLSEAVERMANGTLPDRAVSITFDDGYADNYTRALPVLQKWRVPATVFVATKYLDGGAMWNDRVIESVRAAIGDHLDLGAIGLDRNMAVTVENQARVAQDILTAIKHWDPQRREDAVDYISSLVGDPVCDLMLSREQLLKLHEAKVEIGGHTHSHPVLTAIDDERAAAEIMEGKERLEALLGQRLKVFAYPNGKSQADYSRRHRDMVKDAGFIAAVNTELGVSSSRSDFFQLPRYTPWDATALRFLTRLHLARRNVIAN